MTEKPKPPRPPKPAAKPDRAARLAEALRANLGRRKAQQRSRLDPRRNDTQE